MHGTVILDRNGYVLYDNDNNEIRRRLRSETEAAVRAAFPGPERPLSQSPLRTTQ